MKIIIYFILIFSSFSNAEKIVCSNNPIKSIVQEIVGYNTSILTITEYDENIIGYKPTAEEIAQSGRSKVFFYSSEFLENWVLDIPNNNKIALVNFIPEDKAIYLGDSLLADFWWLDPLTTKAVAEKIADTLSLIYPNRANNFKINLNQFSNKLDVLHKYIISYFGTLSFEPIYDEFPVLTYFAETFNLPYADYLYPKYGLPISPNEEFEEGIELSKAHHLVYYSEYMTGELNDITTKYKLTNSLIYPFGNGPEQNYSDVIKEIAKELKKVYSN